MQVASSAMRALSWKQLAPLASWSKNYENGPTNAQSRLRPSQTDTSEIRAALIYDTG